jgi:hypothetical protein
VNKNILTKQSNISILITSICIFLASGTLSFAGQTDKEADTIAYGDVLMRSLRVWPLNPHQQINTLETANAFRVSKIVWIYENSREFNDKVRQAGMGIGTTMSHNAREIWYQQKAPAEREAFVRRFTTLNLDGEQAVGAHFTRLTDGRTQFFVADQTNPEWIAYYIDFVESLYNKGIDTIHRDDPASNTWSLRSGGTFTDTSVAYFRRFLKDNFNQQQLSDWGIADVDTFDISEHFKSLGAPRDDELWQWRGSPLMPVFTRAMRQADRDFFMTVRQEVEARTGRIIPWSLNQDGPVQPWEEALDFRITEMQRHHNQPRTMLDLAEYPRLGGKRQALISVVDDRWTQHPADLIATIRRNIPTAYGLGMLPLVPWDMYMKTEPRYYGTVEDFADLFHFVADHRALFDGHELIAVSGIDNQPVQHAGKDPILYNWLPNRELVFADGDASARVWLGREDVFAFVRKPADNKHAVVHLVDWNADRRAFQLSFSPRQLIDASAARVTLFRADGESRVFDNYTGGMLTIPEMNPSSLLLVEPMENSGQRPEAPYLLSPLRSVVAQGSPIVFAEPKASVQIRARFISDGSENPPPFELIEGGRGPVITGNGVLEAYVRSPASGLKSETLKIRFATFTDHTVAEMDGYTQTLDLSQRFSVKTGEAKVNNSFLADSMRMMGRQFERGISTSGNTALSVAVDPQWAYFSVNAGLDDMEDRRPSVRMQVWFDGVLAYETPIINPSKLMLDDTVRQAFSIRLQLPQGLQQLELRAVNNGFFPKHNHVIWAEPTAHMAVE